MSRDAWQRSTSLIDRLTVGSRWLTLAVMATLGIGLLWHTTGDLDLLLHDRTGQAILDGQGIPRTNEFSFTASDHRWVDHEWLFQVFVAAAGNLTGADEAAARDAGWRWLRLLLGLALILALGRDISRGRDRPAAWVLAVLGLLCLSMLWTRLTLRPELVSYTLLVLVLGRIEAAIRDEGAGSAWRRVLDPRRPAGQATLLTWLWYQCHGFAALAGLIWLLAGLLDGPGIAWRTRLARAGLGLLGTLLVGLLTPNALPGLLYPLHAWQQATAGPDLHQTISELVPLLETRGSLALTLLAFKASLAWCCLWLVWRWPAVSRLRLALWLLALIAAWQGQRNLGLYAVALVLLHTSVSGAGPSRLETPVSNRLRRVAAGRATAWAGLGATLIAWTLAGIWLADVASDRFYLREGVARRAGAGLTPANYPLAQAGLLVRSGRERIAVTVDAASSVIAAGGRVNIDGRTEAYPAVVWEAYRTFKGGGPAGMSQLTAWDADAVCLAHRNPASQALVRTLAADAGWQLRHVDAAGIAFTPAVPGNPPPDWSVQRQAAAGLLGRLERAEAGQVRLADEAAAWASLLSLLGPDPLAQQLLMAAERSCPDHPVVLHNLGNQLLAMGDHRSALRRFERAARLNRAAAPPLVNAGTCQVNLGDLAAAARSLEAAVRRDPRSFEGWANLAEVRRQQGDGRGARAAYRHALELRPQDQRLRQRAREIR